MPETNTVPSTLTVCLGLGFSSASPSFGGVEGHLVLKTIEPSSSQVTVVVICLATLTIATTAAIATAFATISPSSGFQRVQDMVLQQQQQHGLPSGCRGELLLQALSVVES